MLIYLFNTVQSILDPTRGNVAGTFSSQCPGFPVLGMEQIPLFLFIISFYPTLKNLFTCSTQGHRYTPPPRSSLPWPVLSYCTFFLFHILVLQPVAFALHVNLDFVLCPAPRWSKDFFLLIIFGRCNDILKRHRNMFVSELCSIFFLHFNLSLCIQ